jgi:hypothetical protein
MWDIVAGAMLREDSARFTVIYRLLLRAARGGGDFALLGQDELGTSVFESARAWPGGCCWSATSSRGRTVQPPNAWTRVTAWPPALATTWPSRSAEITSPRQYCGRPPLPDTLLFPDHAERPRRKYLDWHREKVFVA